MADQSLTCPNCGEVIQLSAALTQQIEEKLRKGYEAEVRRQAKEHAEALKVAKQEWEENQAEERLAIEKAAKKKAEAAQQLALKDLQAQLDEQTEKLKDAQKAELAMRKRQRELEQKEADLKLEVARTIDKERAKITEEAASRLAEQHRMKDLEQEKQLADMRKQIEDLQRKAEQASQQLQGEVLELEIEAVLREQFRSDEIAPVNKGTKGADVLQKVFGTSGSSYGSILWESKRTKAWSDGWISKLKDDQREAKADIAVMVSVALPKGISRIGYIEGIWVCDFQSIIGLGLALRTVITQVANAKKSSIGKSEKMELLYRYLSGPEFKHRIEAIVESFVEMKEDLDAERRATEKTWARREKQIQRIVLNTSGMYGDLQGMVGASLPQIQLLELPQDIE